MGERKVQAKYYPPDFDPSALPRIRRKNENNEAVRFMLPMSVRCDTCGEFMGTGLKFNARKSSSGDHYLGIKILQFSMKCKACPATFIIATDPQHSGYRCVSGVRRNYEPWRDKNGNTTTTSENDKEDKEKEGIDDGGGDLEKVVNKTDDTRKAMAELDALDEIKAANSKRARVDIDAVLKAHNERTRIEQQGTALTHDDDDDDDAYVRREMAKMSERTHTERTNTNTDANGHGGAVKRYKLDSATSVGVRAITPNAMTLKVRSRIAKERRIKKSDTEQQQPSTERTNGGADALQSLCAYDDASSSSSESSVGR